MLSSFKQPFPEIKKAIEYLDEQALSTEQVMALRQFTPTSEEVRGEDEGWEEEGIIFDNNSPTHLTNHEYVYTVTKWLTF